MQIAATYYSEDKYLEILANEISAQVNLPGDKIQALSESSFDAWIKYYRRKIFEIFEVKIFAETISFIAETISFIVDNKII